MKSGTLRRMLRDERTSNKKVLQRVEWLYSFLDYRTQKAFAESFGASEQQYTNWKTEKQDITSDACKAIKIAHGVSMDFLVFGEADTLRSDMKESWFRFLGERE